MTWGSLDKLKKLEKIYRSAFTTNEWVKAFVYNFGTNHSLISVDPIGAYFICIKQGQYVSHKIIKKFKPIIYQGTRFYVIETETKITGYSTTGFVMKKTNDPAYRASTTPEQRRQLFISETGDNVIHFLTDEMYPNFLPYYYATNPQIKQQLMDDGILSNVGYPLYFSDLLRLNSFKLLKHLVPYDMSSDLIELMIEKLYDKPLGVSCNTTLWALVSRYFAEHLHETNMYRWGNSQDMKTLLNADLIAPLQRAMRIYLNPHYYKYGTESIIDSPYFHKMTTIQDVNSFVEENTGGKIKKLLTKEFNVQPIGIDGTLACFVIAEYIKLSWKNKFKVAKTHDSPFTSLIEKKQIMVPMMSKEEPIPFYQHTERFPVQRDTWKIVSLASEGDGHNDYEVIIGLPEENTEASLKKMIREFVRRRWEYIDKMKPQLCEFKMPRVKLNSDIQDMISVGKKLDGGRMAIFSGEDNPLKNILKTEFFEEYPDSSIYISQYKTVCTMNLNEEGAEAAAAATMVADHVFRSINVPPPPFPFICDRAYMTAIVRNSEIYFITAVTGESEDVFDKQAPAGSSGESSSEPTSDRSPGSPMRSLAPRLGMTESDLLDTMEDDTNAAELLGMHISDDYDDEVGFYRTLRM